MRKIVKEVTVVYEDGRTETFHPDKGKKMWLVKLPNHFVKNGQIYDRFIDYSVNWVKSREG